MRKPIDLYGKNFGILTVLYPNGTSSDGSVRWLCRCKCGDEKTVNGNSLRSGVTKSCGCLKNGGFIDLTKRIFGRLKVIKLADRPKPGHYRWLCKCRCGTKCVITGHNLRHNMTKSCGCLKHDILMKRNIKHSHAKRGQPSKIYKTWAGMKGRCNDPNDSEYKNYGNRGIKVCKRWDKFENFLKDMGNPPTKTHMIDRINNNQGYSKSNCRWATAKQQQRNKRNNHLLTFNGKTQCLASWSEEFGIDYFVLKARINTLKWSVKKALTEPVRKQQKRRKK